MAVQVALLRAKGVASQWQRLDSQCRKSITLAQLVLVSGVAASPKTVRSVWRPNVVLEAQPLRWSAEHESCSSDDTMVQRACHARQRAREAAEALPTVDVGEGEPHSPTTIRVHGCGHRNRVVVNVFSFQGGSVIDLMSTGTVRVTGSDVKE
ncbi:Alpha-glucosidase yihQ [Hordeum vulgare]|nr:Alpha-glucosidase yihQ [Hordeum vulgare]